MRKVETLLHFTRNFDIIKKIIENGFEPSYAIERFEKRKIMIPMISFSNILFRDIGENEVVDYGNYGIGIHRDTAIKLNLNPVVYVYENSIIDQSITDLHNLTVLPQALDIIKKVTKVENFTKVTDYIKFEPIQEEVKELLNCIKNNTDDNLIRAIKKFAVRANKNSYHQLLLAKPYKVFNKAQQEKVAYNEREWRKIFPELKLVFETDIKGNITEDFTKWSRMEKPHFRNEPNILKVDIEDISHIILDNEKEIDELKIHLKRLFTSSKIEELISKKKLNIGTLQNHKDSE